MPTPPDHFENGLWGLLVGDAAGVPYEFHPPEALPADIDLFPPAGFARSYAHIPPGTWSDDGAQALCLAASFLACGKLDLANFATRLLAWSTRGEMAVDGRVFDIGIQTGEALRRLAQGIPPERSGLSGERNNGNGSLMRCLPLALLHRGPDAKLANDAARQSLVTHAHPRAQACCALYALWARAEMAASPRPWESAIAAFRAAFAPAHPMRAELESVILPAASLPPTASGYVVDSLHSARHACEGTTYREIIIRAIRLGHDTDTTACLAGGIAGIRHGKSGIPSEWIAGLRGTNLLHPLISAASSRLIPSPSGSSKATTK